METNNLNKKRNERTLNITTKNKQENINETINITNKK